MNKNILMFCGFLTFASPIVIHSMDDNTRELIRFTIKNGAKQNNKLDEVLHLIKKSEEKQLTKRFHKAIFNLTFPWYAKRYEKEADILAAQKLCEIKKGYERQTKR